MCGACSRGEELTSPPLDRLGPEADHIEPDELAARFAERSVRLHGFLRDQRSIAGLGRRLANEVCHRAKLSPFAMTGKLGLPARRRSSAPSVTPSPKVSSTSAGATT